MPIDHGMECCGDCGTANRITEAKLDNGDIVIYNLAGKVGEDLTVTYKNFIFIGNGVIHSCGGVEQKMEGRHAFYRSGIAKKKTRRVIW